MVAVIMFTISVMMIQSTINASIEKTSIEGFGEVVSRINFLCWSFEGNTREYDLKLGETIEGIYATADTHKEYASGELTGEIIAEENSFGDNLCIKIQNKMQTCEKLDCNATFPVVGSVPEKFSLSLLINQLTGRGKIFEYSLKFLRSTGKSGVEVFLGAFPATTA